VDPRSLFYELLHAEDETEVLALLTKRGLMDLSDWQHLGDIDNNFGIVGNQQQDATGAVVEKIINSLDANLMRASFEAGVDPEGADAPTSMSAAVERFFGVPKGRVGDLGTQEQRRLAELTQFVAVGSKTDPSYLVIDLGEGQTPQMQPQTFLSLGKKNKMRIPFVQGKFNAGGTGVLPFCGQHNLQLVASKRHPKAPTAHDDNTASRWGFTIIRRLRPSENQEASKEGIRQPPRTSVYVYLAPGGKVLSFGTASILALPTPGKSNQAARAYAEPLEWGSVLKLYNFRWARKSLATTDARYELERYLHSPCLPFRVVETRDYRAHYYSTTVVGVWADIAGQEADPEKARVDPGFPASASMNLPGVGELPYKIALFQEGTEMKRVPHGVHFVVNGQSHGQLPADFVSSRLQFPYLSDELLVSVDCTAMDEDAREDFFMASRDRLRRNDTYYKVVDALTQDLRAHPGLRQANAARRAKLLEKSLGQQEDVANTLNELLSADPALQALFSVGDRLISKVGPTEVEKYTGKRFPTYFHLEDQPKGGLVKSCPVNRTCRIDFVTDAVNDYFSRAESPGLLAITPSNAQEHGHLWNGVYHARFRPPDGAKPGQTYKVDVEVTDPQREALGKQAFNTSFELKIEKELETPTRPGPPVKPKKPTKNGKRAPRLSMPNVVSVREPEWANFKPPFDAEQAFRVVPGEEDDSYDFYVNLDCKHLIGYLRTTKDDEHDLVRHWFKWGLTLCVLGLLHGYELIGQEPSPNGAKPESAQTSDGDSTPERRGEALKAINRSVNGLGAVIIPIIKNLYHPLVMSKS
jgi:hypothetical protein